MTQQPNPQPQPSQSPSTSSSPQYQPLGLIDVRRALDSKFVNTGIPGAIAGFGISRAFEGEWWQFLSLAGVAAGVWFLIKLGAKIAPRMEQVIDQADQMVVREVERTIPR
jgi:hypothetical protein